MAEESATRDPLQLSGEAFAAAARHDIDALTAFYAKDAVWDMSDGGMGSFQGRAAIRRFFEDWWATWDDHQLAVHDFVNYGQGLQFAEVWEDGRLAGSDARVEHRRGWVSQWVDGLVVRVTVYLDADEGRAAAERLAAERG
jgi:ketosteroid isomerase-like protein